MSNFLTPLIVEEIDDQRWGLTSDLLYQSDIFGGVIKVPYGFVTDFASVPRWPLAFWAAGDTAHQAATIHDLLYQTHLKDRETCDKILLEAMEVTGIPIWRRKLMYYAVRTFGMFAYNSGPERYEVLGNLAKFSELPATKTK